MKIYFDKKRKLGGKRCLIDQHLDKLGGKDYEQICTEVLG